MKTLNNDIISSKTEEGDEIMPVSSNGLGHSPFTGKIASSNLVAGTKKNSANDWRVEPCGNDFSIKRTTEIIGGNAFSRMSLE